MTLALVLGIGTVILTSNEGTSEVSGGDTENVEVVDGIQTITITAKGGYSPRVTTAASGIPTKLVVRTEGTYDCSLSLVIRDLNFQKILSATGEEVIDLGTPEANDSLQGLCSMGMYSFKLEFI